jgi:hypothetical protein
MNTRARASAYSLDYGPNESIIVAHGSLQVSAGWNERHRKDLIC